MGFHLPRWAWLIVSFTWGALISIPGLIVTLILAITTGCRPQRYNYGWYIKLPGNFGGLNLGPFMFVSHEELLSHEFGHSIQNCIFGPFTLIFVCIPSILRYWYRAIFKVTQPDYDYAWFEGQATMFGDRYSD